MRIDKWSDEPWQVVEDVEFRAVTLVAVKGESGVSVDCGHTVIYRGPYASVSDDEGRTYARGERLAVSERTFRQLTEGPYREDFIGLTPSEARHRAPCCPPAGTRGSTAKPEDNSHNEPSLSSGCCG